MASQTTLKAAGPKWLEHLEAAGKQERTVATYGRQFAVIAGFFGEDKALGAIRVTDVGRFLKSDALLKMPTGKARAERTVAQIVRVLRMMLEWAKDEGLVKAVPFPKAAMPKRPRKAKN
jgi:site-specific recombinase XerC